MRYLRDVHDLEELHRLRSRLEEAGIATATASLSVRRGGTRLKLFALINSQYEDALLALDDPTHRAAEPLDPETLRRIREEQDELPVPMLDGMLGWLMALAGLLFVLVLAWFALTRR